MEFEVDTGHECFINQGIFGERQWASDYLRSPNIEALKRVRSHWTMCNISCNLSFGQTGASTC